MGLCPFPSVKIQFKKTYIDLPPLKCFWALIAALFTAVIDFFM